MDPSVSHIRVLICRVDDPASDQMTALAAFDLPETDLTTLKPETALDDLETTIHTTGNAILQRALQAQWDVIDDQLTVQHRQSFPPRTIHAGGHEPITVASRFGILTLSRQVCTVDELLTRRPEAGHFLELRTARIMTERGSRYLSGIGAVFLQHLQLAVLLCLEPLSSLLLIADGARWIRSFFTDTLAALADKTMILDCHHLKQKCLELGSRICRGRLAQAQLLRRLYRRLWRGDVAGAIAVLEAERGETKNEAKLDELIGYL
jgi:hypothetical protein